MITLLESGLTAQQYSDIQDNFGDLSVEILLQRYGPAWSQHPDQSAANNTGECFDAIKIGEYILRAFGDTTSEISAQYLASEVSYVTDASWTGIDCTAITAADTDVPISLATDDTGARMFYYTTHGQIWYSDAATHVGPFGAPVLVVDPSDTVIGLAAVSTTKLYYITENSNDNRVFHQHTIGGSATEHLYWSYEIHGFDAVSMTDYDVVMITTNLPPLLSSRAVGTTVNTEVNDVQGVVWWLVANDRWSDWQSMDVIDRVSDRYNPSRDDLRLTYEDDYLFAVYERAGGAGSPDETHAYSRVAVARSKDGKNWEFPEFLEDIPVSPCLIFPRLDYLYAVGVNETLRSPCCSWAGQTPEELDVTARVAQMQTEAAEIRNSSVALISPATSGTNIFPTTLDDTLAMSDDRLQLRYDLGYVMSGTAARVTVSTEDVITRELSRDFQRMGISLGSRDFLGRLNRMRADGAFEWPSMQAGRDHFDDSTGTGYGGMRHLAPYLGSWKASSGVCDLLAVNKRSLAVSTFVTDTFNGSIQTDFQLNATDRDEYAGVAFRVYDKDNFHFVAYYIDDDTVKLYEVRGGEDTLLATSGVMSWESITTWYSLKVVTKYSNVYVYSSTDGITWTAVGTGGFAADGSYELDGDPGTIERSINAMSGKFGLVGYGWKAEQDWPDWDPGPWDQPTPPTVLPTPYIGYVRDSKDDKVYRTENWNTDLYAGPYWTDVTGTLADAPQRIAIDQANRYIYVMTLGNEPALYRGDVDDATPTWTLILDGGDLPDCVDDIMHSMSVTPDGYVGIPAISTAACSTCSDAGSAWHDQGRPLMIVVSPDASVSVLHLAGGATGQCCPTHVHHNAWAWSHASHNLQSPYHMSTAAGTTLRFMTECNGTIIDPDPPKYDCHHTVYASGGDASASLTDEDDFGGEDSESLYMLCDMGTYGFGTAYQDRDVLRKFTYDSDTAWTDVTPTNWAEPAFGFDRDATRGFAVVTDESRLYSSTGSTFAEVVARSDLSELDLGVFRHCSCYCGDPSQLFLAVRYNDVDENGDILWTLDGGDGWISRLGNLSDANYYEEIRVVWTETYG